MSDDAERWDPAMIGGLLGVATALMFLLPAVYWPPELAARTTGGLYQLTGIITVAVGLYDLRKKFGKGPGPFMRLLRRSWHRVRRPWRKPKPQTIEVGFAKSTAQAFSPTIVQGMPKSGSLEEQVANLQKFAEQLQTQADALRADRKKERRERIEAGNEERKARSEADQKLRQAIEELAIGGLTLEAWGVFWLLIGTVFLTWPEVSVPLSRFFHP